MDGDVCGHLQDEWRPTNLAMQWVRLHMDLLAEFSLCGQGTNPGEVDLHCKLRCTCVLNDNAHQLLIQDPDRFDRQAADWVSRYASSADGSDNDTDHWGRVVAMIDRSDGDWDRAVSSCARAVLHVASRAPEG